MIELARLDVADPPDVWERLGFAVGADGVARVGATAVRLAAEPGRGMIGWGAARRARPGRARRHRHRVVRGARGDGPARLWGLVAVVEDLDAVAAALGDRLGAVHDAVQRGRRIATVRSSAGSGTAMALMSKEIQ